MSAGRPVALESRIAGVAASLGLEHPEIVELSGGVANRSFRLRDRRHDVVLRFAGDVAAGLGASGASELAMQSLAAGAGLAPPLLLADAARGFVVSDFVPGSVPTARDLQNAHMLRRVGAFIARLHALAPPPGLPVVDFGERAAGYLERVMRTRRDAFVERLQRELAARRAALPPPVRLAACHHDLHHRNFLDDGQRLIAVDWEYAGPGDAAADLASCIGYHALEAADVNVLFESYDAADTDLRSRVAALGWIFDCLWFGWNAAASLGGLAIDHGEQTRLAARLGG
jgi:Ser/Thr protein kinase RdoA (MazF antagonist)